MLGSPTLGTLGKYELLRHLATGGMAEIFLARTTGIGGFEKLLVLKRILPHLAAKEDFVRMFLDEARTAASLHHTNIVQVHDAAQQDGVVFYAMEFVHGEDCRTIIKTSIKQKRHVPFDIVLAIVVNTAAGLHYAHTRRDARGHALGLVHRDVSPSNVIVTFEGTAKVGDFGIAKSKATDTETRSGVVKGKAAYMSPEQIKSEPLDGRSDVFSLGIVLWELTTRRKLFKADTQYAIMQKIANENAPPPSKFRKDYPPQLEAIVMKALSRNRDDRYESAEAMREDIEAFALEARMQISTLAVAKFMRAVFAERIQAWEQAEALGHSLVDLVPMPADLPTPTIPRTEARLREPAATGTSPSLVALDEEAPPKPKGRRFGVAVLLVLGVLAIVGAFVLGQGSKSDADRSSLDREVSEVVPPPAAPSPPADKAPPEVAPPEPAPEVAKPAVKVKETPPKRRRRRAKRTRRSIRKPKEVKAPPPPPPKVEPPPKKKDELWNPDSPLLGD